MDTGTKPHGTSRRRENGSAYIIVLLVLLLLTTIGLSLVFVTATEMQIGANERSQQRNLAAADSGVAVAISQILATGQYSGATIFLPSSADEDPADPPLIQNRVVLERTPIIASAPCRLCQINEEGTYGANTYKRGAVAVTARGQRPGFGGSVSETMITATLDLQPVKLPAGAFNDANTNQGGLEAVP